jgi:hypothetical protein
VRTEVIDRPVFESAHWLRELVRRNRQASEPACAIDETPPYAPTSSFVTPDDQVIECEVE